MEVFSYISTHLGSYICFFRIFQRGREERGARTNEKPNKPKTPKRKKRSKKRHSKLLRICLILEHRPQFFETSCAFPLCPRLYNLGNVRNYSIRDMVASDQQRNFGNDKRDTLPKYCRECEFRFACNGGCPKQRFTWTPDGEPGLNYLCKGYKIYFAHIAPYMEFMATQLRRNRPAATVMDWVRHEDRKKSEIIQKPIGRNDPCPCKSGLKYKRCCGAWIIIVFHLLIN